MILPTDSPWGRVQDWSNIAEGINFASAASHGGIHLSPERQKQMPKGLKHQSCWYEEDCECARVMLAFPECFNHDSVESAKQIMKNYYPDDYEKWSGEKVSPEESSKIREQNFNTMNHKNFVVRSAINRGNGIVHVAAWQASTGIEKFFQVPKDEYAANRYNFVIDLTRHKEVDSF